MTFQIKQIHIYKIKVHVNESTQALAPPPRTHELISPDQKLEQDKEITGAPYCCV